jgi:transposase-like protein
MDEAIADLNSSATPCVAQVARKYGLSRSTLSRRWRGVTTSKGQSVEDHRFLNDNQERELKNYIERLCERCLPPTPAIVSQIAAKLAGKEPGSNWCSRFVERHKAELDSRYLNSLDLQRHHADSVAKYEQYFDTVRSKMREYDIRPEDCYSMDEKGFLIGRTHKAKRVFNKDLKASGRLLGAGQDGSREWITVVGCICADGTTLPPLLIYKSKANTLQDCWLEDFDAEKHDCWFTSSPNGWTTDEVGLKWLDRLFHERTKDKSRWRWRLLFVDGHGSHVTLPFLEQAYKHRILVAVYPPHATHRLQPLDVGCFAPLATYYSQNLEQFTIDSEGLTRLQKRDLFRLFFPAWHEAFTEKNVVSSWRKAGLFPFNPNLVLS